MIVCVEQEGRTALMLACWKGYLEIVKELLRAGARTDTQDQVSVCVCTKRRKVMCDCVHMFCMLYVGGAYCSYSGHAKGTYRSCKSPPRCQG